MALISNGTTIASGGSVSYNRLTDTPTIPTNTNQLTNGAGFITSATPPTTLGAVGTYALMRNDGGGFNTNIEPGATLSGSAITYANAHATGYTNTSATGTWRCMGWAAPQNADVNYGNKTTVYVRIS